MTTWVLERSLATGTRTWAPVVAPELCAAGDGPAALEEVRVFLAEHLATAPAALAARYFLPAGVEVRLVPVALEPGVVTRPRGPRTVDVVCVLVPHGAEGRDRFGLVPALGAAFFVDRRESVDEVAAREVARLCAASDLDGGAWRRLLPPLEATVVPLEVPVRFAPVEHATVARVAAEERRRAHELLDEHATAVAARVGGGAPALVARERELASLTALLGGRERLAVVLCGEVGVGKSALFEAWARAHPARAAWVVSVARVVAGASGFGEAEARLTALCAAAERLDAVLYFEDFGSLFRERVEDGGLALGGIVRRFVVEARVRVVAEIAPAALDLAERRDVALVGAMTRLVVAATTPAVTVEVVAAQVAHWHRAEPRRPRVAPAAIPVAVELARRYLPYRAFPGKAVAVLEELRAAADGEVDPDGRPRTLGVDAVYDGFALATGVPAFLLRDDQPLVRDELIARLGQRMIGQRAAVARVAETLCTVKAQLQPADKPLATFLFVGPTGVGKTELAKRLAHLLFGAEERLARFDMSEYADPWAAERLIRGNDRGDGLLTARIRQQPFVVLLLDEIEKAHPAVHDLLLQVAGEGRLTDARGRTAYFHNAIVIMTSNLGATRTGARLGLAAPDDDEPQARELARYRAAVTEAFRPEMLNRLDAIIAFHRLDADEIAAVTRLALAQLATRRGLVAQGQDLDVSAAAIAALAAGGYAPAYGVRALRRHLEQAVVTPVARLVARLGATAAGALVTVRAVDEPAAIDLPAGAHLGSEPATGGVVVAAWRRGGGGGRRDLRGPHLAGDARRHADAWLRRDVATDVATQLDWLKAQLARGDRQGSARATAKAALASTQLQQMAIERARLEHAWQAAVTAKDELTVVEDLVLAAPLGSDDVAAAVALVEPMVRAFEHAMFWLAVARREARDEITLALSAPEHHAGLSRWVSGLLGACGARGWAITAHATAARDPDPLRVDVGGWGRARDRAWLAEQVAAGALRTVLLRVRGPGAACLLGLEAGAHRFVGIAPTTPCHLVIRRVALATEFTAPQWARLAATAAPAAVPRGAVEREHPDERAVVVRGARLELPWPAYFARLEQVGLAVLDGELASGRAIDELYPVELVDPDDAEADDAGAAP
ncbi:MAG: AAA family ATPase [Kofleriaceae bacterium]